MTTKRPGVFTRIREWAFGAVVTVRRYKAALNNRLHKNWTTWSRSANSEIYSSLRTLRARSREEFQNNPLFRKYGSLCRSNIVGVNGLQLQAEARKSRDGKLDTRLNRQVEELWWEFCQRGNFSASGKLSAVDFQNLVVTSTARDGETLAQIIRIPGSKFGIGVRHFASDYLDETYNENTRDGNRIIMSVEVDSLNRPAAYHLTTPTDNIMWAERKERRRTRVPAEEMIHAHLVFDEEEQVRAVPWTHAALLKAKYLDSLQDAVLVAAQMGANQWAVITSDAPTEEPAFTGSTATEPESPLTIDSRPGMVTVLDPGMKLDAFKPEQPGENHAAHVKLTQGDIATALDVPYFELTGDLSEVNFSSSRIGLSQSRDVWKARQQWLGDIVMTKIYLAFLDAIWKNGLIKLTPNQFDELKRHSWRGRGWSYIQPKDEAEANEVALRTGQTTLGAIWLEQGKDFDDQIQKILSEKERLKEAGIDFSQSTDKTSGNTADDTNDTGDEPTGKQKKKDKVAKV